MKPHINPIAAQTRMVQGPPAQANLRPNRASPPPVAKDRADIK